LVKKIIKAYLISQLEDLEDDSSDSNDRVGNCSFK